MPIPEDSGIFSWIYSNSLCCMTVTVTLSVFVSRSLSLSGGDLEEAESTSVKIVTSPYIIDMSKTKKYFTPGGKFSILVQCGRFCTQRQMLTPQNKI